MSKDLQVDAAVLTGLGNDLNALAGQMRGVNAGASFSSVSMSGLPIEGACKGAAARVNKAIGTVGDRVGAHGDLALTHCKNFVDLDNAVINEVNGMGPA